MESADKPDPQAKLPGGLTIWQAGGVTMGSMLLTAAMGVNTLMERSANDREAVKHLQIQVGELSKAVNSLTTEVARQNVVLGHLQSTKGLRDSRN